MGKLVGLLVNPFAGMGGRAGLHGTDGAERLAEAVRRGATPVTPARAKRAVQQLATRADLPGLELLAVPGPMGAEIATASGLDVRALDVPIGRTTTANDTKAAARKLATAGVDLLLFAGGDGTASDIVAAVGQSVPILGIPAGVKMRSGVFASTPEAAGELAADFLARTQPGPPGDRAAAGRGGPVPPRDRDAAGRGGPGLSGGWRRPVRIAEVIDVDEHGVPDEHAVPDEHGGRGVPPGVLRGIAVVPDLRDGRLLGTKTSTTLGSRAELDALARAMASELAPGTLYLFGPGSTTARVLSALGIEGTPLGVDAVVDGVLVGKDLSEVEIVALMATFPRARLVLGVVGGQGVLLGRGNQQLGPRVLSRLSPDDVTIVASAEKLVGLQPPLLRVDAGDETSFPWAEGYRRVRVGPSRYMMMRVAAA